MAVQSCAYASLVNAAAAPVSWQLCKPSVCASTPICCALWAIPAVPRVEQGPRGSLFRAMRASRLGTRPSRRFGFERWGETSGSRAKEPRASEAHYDGCARQLKTTLAHRKSMAASVVHVLHHAYCGVTSPVVR